MMRIICLTGLAGLVMVSCAHTQEPVSESAPPPAPRCSVVQSVAATRVPKPGPRACTERAAMLKGCRAGEAGACYQFAFCLSGELLGRSTMSPEDKQDYVNAITTSLDVACRGGVSEGCVLRAGMRQETGTPAPQTCDDVVRACQLGDEADGCLACFKDGC